MGLFSKSSPMIGLDIGSSAIKLVQLQETAKGFQLAKFGMVPLTPEVIVDGAIMDANRVVEAIRVLLQEQRVKSKDTAISVSGHSVIAKRIPLPEMSEEELSESIRWEAEQYIPFAIDDVNLDFQILGKSPDKQGQMDVLLVAVKKEKITDYLTTVTEAGLNPLIVDVDAFAVENMHEINYEFERNRVVALINLGASVMNINILKDGVSIFTRDSAIGGNQYTEAIQKELGLSYEQAERAKRGEEVTGVKPDDIQPLLQNVSAEVCTEISRTFDFFKATSAQDRIDQVLLCGGCALLPRSDRFFSERLEVPVSIADPFRNIQIDTREFDYDHLKRIAPVAGVGVGLALRRLGDR